MTNATITDYAGDGVYQNLLKAFYYMTKAHESVPHGMYAEREKVVNRILKARDEITELIDIQYKKRSQVHVKSGKKVPIIFGKSVVTDAVSHTYLPDIPEIGRNEVKMT